MGRRVAVHAGILALSAIAPLLAGCGSTTIAHSAPPSSAIACSPTLKLFGPPPPSPQASSRGLATAIVARYAIFRRAARPDDAPPIPVREAAQEFTLARWYPAEVRLLGERSRNARYYAIPGFGRREALPSGCRPARLRRALETEQQHRLTEPVVCLLMFGSDGNGSLGCEPFAEIEAQADVFASGGLSDSVVSLVPDGVSTLRIFYRSGPPIAVPVAGNAVVFAPPPPSRRLRVLQQRAAALSDEEGGCYRAGHGPWVCGNPHLTAAQNRRVELRFERADAAYRRAEAAADPTRIQWLDAAGRVVRTLAPPTPAQLAAVDVGQLSAPITG